MFIILSRNDFSRQKLAHIAEIHVCCRFQQNSTAPEVIIYSEMLRHFLTLLVTIFRDERAIRNFVCLSSERGMGFRAAYLQ